jgi:hypothetical protein
MKKSLNLHYTKISHASANSMKKEDIKIYDFSEHLFWDVDKNKLDFEKHQKYIIKYVLMYGLYEDWKLLKQLYGIKKIGKNASEIKDLDKKTASFVALLSQKNVKEFACYTSTQSMSKHWNF